MKTNLLLHWGTDRRGMNQVMNVFLFASHLTEVQRDGFVISLRKSGFKASREQTTLRTNASHGEALLVYGHGQALGAGVVMPDAYSQSID